MSELVIIALSILAAAAMCALAWFAWVHCRGKALPDSPLFLPPGNFAERLRGVFEKGAGDRIRLAAEIEEILLSADAGPAATERLVAKAFANASDPPERTFEILKTEILRILTPANPFRIAQSRVPFVIYVVGVNGSGKTTTVAKLSRLFKREGRRVLVVSADTFRAAAGEQLRVWAEREGVDLVVGAPGADPASVIVEGLRAGLARGAEVVLVDTAGRLHTKTNLLEELKKMARMSEKVLGRAPDEVWLTLDAIAGQNGLNQARDFLAAANVTGIVLTKYDATAKGGVVIAVSEETGLPLRFLGLGEKADELRPFDPEAFVERLFG